MEIEIFRVGTFTDSKGDTRTYSLNDLHQIANLYNSSLSKNASVIAPIVKGHPKDNSPAFAWTSYLKVVDDKLIAGIRDISPEFMQEINEGKFKKVSISLYPDLLLRHIGFLGAMAPAVSGLEPAEYIDYYAHSLEDLSNNSTGENKDITEKEFNYAEELQKLQERISIYQKDIAEYQMADRISEYKKYCNKITEISQNYQLNQIIQDDLPALMNIAFEYDSQNSSNDENLTLIKNFAEKLVKLPIISKLNFENKEKLNSYNHQNLDYNLYSKANENIEQISKIYSNSSKYDSKKLALHNNAIEIMKSHPNLSYEEALEYTEM